MNCGPVMAERGEGLKAEYRLQFDMVLAPGLLPMSVLVPAFDTDLELADNLFQQGWKRRLIDTQDDPGIAHVAKQHGETQTIGRAAPLPDDGQIAFTERVVADQLILASGNANRLCFSIAERI